jgi:cytochrome c
MRLLKITVLCMIALGLVFSSAFAMKHTPEERGKALFNDPKAFGGQKACSSCHPDGKGMDKAAAKSEWTTPAGKTKTLEEAINLCIVNANKGKALEAKSEQMKDMVAYIKSLGKKEAPKKPKMGGY